MSVIILSVNRRRNVNVCLCHSETRQFCPVSQKSSDFVLSASWLTCAGRCVKKTFPMWCLHVWPQCVWDLRALYKSLIQVFDFKANGDSSGGWAGGKMLRPLQGHAMLRSAFLCLVFFCYTSYDLSLSFTLSWYDPILCIVSFFSCFVCWLICIYL